MGEMRLEGERRAAEVAATMASHVEEIRLGHRPADADEDEAPLGPTLLSPALRPPSLTLSRAGRTSPAPLGFSRASPARRAVFG